VVMGIWLCVSVENICCMREYVLYVRGPDGFAFEGSRAGRTQLMAKASVATLELRGIGWFDGKLVQTLQ
jgi:hypothetical protein